MHHIPKAYEFAMKESSIATLISVHPVHLYGNFAETKYQTNEENSTGPRKVYFGEELKNMSLFKPKEKKIQGTITSIHFHKNNSINLNQKF